MCGAPFDTNLGLDRGGNWLGRPEGASSSTDLIEFGLIGAKNGGGRRVSRREKKEEREREEGEKEKEKFDVSGFRIFQNPNL